MPCDTIQRNSIEIAKMNPALLLAALKAMGARSIFVNGQAASFTLDGESCTIRNGRMIVSAGSEHLADKVKQGYSRQCVFQAARVNGWQIKETKKNVFQVVK